MLALMILVQRAKVLYNCDHYRIYLATLVGVFTVVCEQKHLKHGNTS